MLPEFAAGTPEQLPFRHQSTFTFPVGTGCAGSASEVDTVTKSCTVEPAATAVTTWGCALWMSVAVCDVRLTMIVCAGACAWLFAFGSQLDPFPVLHCQVKSS